MKNSKRAMAVMIIVIMLMSVLSGCSPAPKASEEVIIGYVGPLTGPSATMGLATRQGAELAIEEINAADGIMGNKIKFIIRDDEADPTKSNTAVQEDRKSTRLNSSHH